MIKQLFKDTAIYSFGKILVYGIGLFLIPLYTRVFDPTAFGIIDLLNILTAVVSVTVALEIAHGLFRSLADADAEADRVAYSSTALLFTVLMYTVFVLVTWLVPSSFFEAIFHTQIEPEILRLSFLTMGVNGIFSLLQNQFRWNKQAKIYTAVSIFDTVISLGLIILLVVVFRVGLVGVFWGQLIGLVAGVGLASFYARANFRLQFDWAKCKEMLRYSIPFVPSSLSVLAYTYIDRIMINNLMSLEDVGIFGVGYRIVSIVTLLTFGFQISMVPLLLSHYRDPQTPTQLAKIFRYYLALALLVIVGLSVFAKDILMVLATPTYLRAWMVVPLLLPVPILSSMLIFAPGLGIAKKSGHMALINVMGIILNGCLNLLLIPLFGLTGAALSSLVSASTSFAVYMIYSQRLYPIPYSWTQIAIGIAVAVTGILVGLQIDVGGWQGILLKMIVMGATGLLFILLGFIKSSELSSMWHSIKPASIYTRT